MFQRNPRIAVFVSLLAGIQLAFGCAIVFASDEQEGTTVLREDRAAALSGGLRPANAGAASQPALAARDPSDQDKDKEDRLEKLRALPYVEFDPDTDTKLVGVTLLDPNRANPGYDLYTDDNSKVYLADLSGNHVHEWRVFPPFNRCEYAKMMPNGEVLTVCVDTGLVHLDWHSYLVWSLKRKVHHDVAVKPDGTILVPVHTPLTYKKRRVWFDDLLHLSSSGKVLGDWSTFDHLDDLRKHHEPSDLDKPPSAGPLKRPRSWNGYDYYHLNTIEVLPKTPLGKRDKRFRAGNLMISLRNTDLIMILDQEDLSVVWTWGPGQLERQHSPTMLKNGNILIFDNGSRRKFSRVIELDPSSKRIVWKYVGDPPRSFYSVERGNAQRLANGDTLICEAEKGHVFEVTPDGEKVWEFWNPELSGNGQRRRIYRMERYPVSAVETLLSPDSRTPPEANPSAGHAPGP